MSVAIRSAAVLGAGTMGSALAAHLVNAGVDVTLFDLTLDAAEHGRRRLRSAKPDPLFVAGTAARIRLASFEDLTSLRSADWVIEAVVENLDAKQDLLARVEGAIGADTIVSSNTSGLPLGLIAEGRSEGFRRRWLGTHFFNPPRYLHLVELIPTPETDPAITDGLAAFLDHRLGKGVVRAHDRPGFIANRLGIFSAARVLAEVAAGALSIDQADALTGPVIGRPKSATFRTADLSGLDILAAVAADLGTRLGGADDFVLPPFVGKMVEKGLLGEKAASGFYRREVVDGESRILTIDPATLTYHPRSEVRLAGLEAVTDEADTAARLRKLFASDSPAGIALRRTLGATLVYAARAAADMTDSIDDIDRAMRWGFGWELGPFEIWDAVGLRTVLETCQVTDVPPLIKDALGRGQDRLRPAGFAPPAPGLELLRTSRERSAPILTNPSASLLDLGDGVLAVELHSKMNTIGGETLAMISEGIRRAEDGHQALVVTSGAEWFSAGANLLLVLLEAQEGNWDEIDLMVRGFQQTTMAMKTASVPVIVAPAGIALGGGCEMCLHAAHVQAAAESYVGLVEVGVGLLPAGGGTKEMLLRATAGGSSVMATQAAIQQAFETIALARVSTSAVDAQRLRLLRDTDGITMNRDRVVADAKSWALARARDDYQPVMRQVSVPVGGADLYARLSLGVHLARTAGRASEHDALIGRKVAWVLSGGDQPAGAHLSEDALLDLEREAFLSLCGEARTIERIAHTLRTGKPLRN